MTGASFGAEPNWASESGFQPVTETSDNPRPFDTAISENGLNKFVQLEVGHERDPSIKVPGS
jgi:hypothetical protein